MKLARLGVRAYAIPFRRPFVTGAGTVTVRRGFVLEIASDDGVVGRGEASPAYWLGDEDLAVTEEVVRGAGTLTGQALAELPAVVGAWATRSPAAACALDTACVDLAARAAGVAFGRQLVEAVEPAAGGDEPVVSATRVPVAALLVSDAVADLEHEAAAAVADGHRTLKLKVGGRPLADDVARAGAVRSAAGAGARLRLDANRAWTADAAQAALAALAPFAPDFIEEPLDAAHAEAWPALRRLARTHDIALARDESIVDEADYVRLGATADVIVVKAARLGGPTAAFAIGRRARADGRRVVVTDSIETATGVAVAAQLAAVLHAPDEAVGLGGPRLLDAAEPRAWYDPGAPGLGEDAHGALAS